MSGWAVNLGIMAFTTAAAACCASQAAGDHSLGAASVAESAEAAPVSVAVDGTDLPPSQQATAWLDALRRGMSLQLRDASAFPFELRDTGTARGCPNRATSVTASNLDSLVACLFDDELLMGELDKQFPPLGEELHVNRIPRWASTWRTELRRDVVPVLVTLSGDGVTFYIVVLSSPIGVQGVWKHAVFDSESE